jgi:hypothetical protein
MAGVHHLLVGEVQQVQLNLLREALGLVYTPDRDFWNQKRLDRTTYDSYFMALAKRLQLVLTAQLSRHQQLELDSSFFIRDNSVTAEEMMGKIEAIAPRAAMRYDTAGQDNSVNVWNGWNVLTRDWPQVPAWADEIRGNHWSTSGLVPRRALANRIGIKMRNGEPSGLLAWFCVWASPPPEAQRSRLEVWVDSNRVGVVDFGRTALASCYLPSGRAQDVLLRMSFQLADGMWRDAQSHEWLLLGVSVERTLSNPSSLEFMPQCGVISLSVTANNSDMQMKLAGLGVHSRVTVDGLLVNVGFNERPQGVIGSGDEWTGIRRNQLSSIENGWLRDSDDGCSLDSSWELSASAILTSVLLETLEFQARPLPGAQSTAAHSRAPSSIQSLVCPGLNLTLSGKLNLPDLRFDNRVVDLWVMREDLQERFPLDRGGSSARFVHWLLTQGSSEAELVDPFVRSLSLRQRVAVMVIAEAGRELDDVNLVEKVSEILDMHPELEEPEHMVIAAFREDVVQSSGARGINLMSTIDDWLLRFGFEEYASRVPWVRRDANGTVLCENARSELDGLDFGGGSPKSQRSPSVSSRVARRIRREHQERR